MPGRPADRRGAQDRCQGRTAGPRARPRNRARVPRGADPHDNGEVVRSVGPPDADEPAARVEVVALGETDTGQQGPAVGVDRIGDRFRVELDDCGTVDARRLVVTTGPTTRCDRAGRAVGSGCRALPVLLRVGGPRSTHRVLVTSPLSLHQAGPFPPAHRACDRADPFGAGTRWGAASHLVGTER